MLVRQEKPMSFSQIQVLIQLTLDIYPCVNLNNAQGGYTFSIHHAIMNKVFPLPLYVNGYS